jgi:hypothetical protein
LRWLIQAIDHAQQRGLASAGAANDADEAARLKVEGHIVNGQCVAKAFAEIAK